MNVYSNNFTGTVFMLQPGLAPIREDAYKGYGEFGGVDCYEWVAKMNLPENVLKGMSKESIRTAGIGLSMGNYYIHKETNEKWSIFHGYEMLIDGCKGFSGSFSDVMPKYNKTPNEMIESGEMIKVPISETELKYPLKFSFNERANYDSFCASDTCPVQGYFDD